MLTERRVTLVDWCSLFLSQPTLSPARRLRRSGATRDRFPASGGDERSWLLPATAAQAAFAAPVLRSRVTGWVALGEGPKRPQ